MEGERNQDKHKLKVSPVKDVGGWSCMSMTILARPLDNTVKPRFKDARNIPYNLCGSKTRRSIELKREAMRTRTMQNRMPQYNSTVLRLCLASIVIDMHEHPPTSFTAETFSSYLSWLRSPSPPHVIVLT